MLRSSRWASRGLSEERLGIRTALASFNAVTRTLRSWHQLDSNVSFETLVSTSAVGSSAQFVGTSCGNSMNCVVSCFLAESQITFANLDQVIGGSELFALWWTPCVTLPSLLVSGDGYKSPVSYAGNWARSHNGRRTIRKICERSAEAQMDAFETQLWLEEPPEKLPRVLLLSLTWTSELGLAGQISEHIQDHKIVCVKAGPDCYQIFQGYMPHTHMPDGYGLLEWQSSGNPYSNPQGISRPQMQEYVRYLRVFVESEIWHGEAHNAICNTSQVDFFNQLVWSSFSFTEIEDADILGYAETPLLTALGDAVRARTVAGSAARGPPSSSH